LKQSSARHHFVFMNRTLLMHRPSLARDLLVVFFVLGCASSNDAPSHGGQGGGGGQANGGAGPATSAGSSAGGATGGGSANAGAANPSGGTPAAAGAPSTAGGAGTTNGAGSGGDATAGGSAGAAPTSPVGFFDGGYLTAGPWKGWVFTLADSLGAGTTVSPACDPNGCTPSWGAQPCASGQVGKDANSATFAGLAFHVNNPMSGGTGTWTTQGDGIYVSITTPPASGRIQLQEPNASSNDQRYCAPLPAGGTGLIPFSSFKTYCWGDAAHPSKVLSSGTQIHEASLIVPGSSSAAQPFDFCVYDFEPR